MHNWKMPVSLMCVPLDCVGEALCSGIEFATFEGPVLLTASTRREIFLKYGDVSSSNPAKIL